MEELDGLFLDEDEEVRETLLDDETEDGGNLVGVVDGLSVLLDLREGKGLVGLDGLDLAVALNIVGVGVFIVGKFGLEGDDFDLEKVGVILAKWVYQKLHRKTVEVPSYCGSCILFLLFEAMEALQDLMVAKLDEEVEKLGEILVPIELAIVVLVEKLEVVDELGAEVVLLRDGEGDFVFFEEPDDEADEVVEPKVDGRITRSEPCRFRRNS